MTGDPKNEPCRAFVLRGGDTEQALAWLHVHSDVQGVLEESDAVVVWLFGVLPTLPGALDVAVEERRIAPADYEITGLEDDVAIAVANDLLVRPPWVDRPLGFAGIELVVPRGGAFGSGEHDSTKAALRVLHRVWLSADGTAPASLADVGTGSGILALYAQVRGCRQIEACDIDLPSVVAARELLPAANVHHGGAELVRPCGLVVANMTGTELAQSLSAILSSWTRERELVLSGMRANEVDGLLAAVGGTVVCRESLGAFTAVALSES